MERASRVEISSTSMPEAIWWEARSERDWASAASAATTSVSSVRYPVASPVAAATRSTKPGYSSADARIRG